MDEIKINTNYGEFTLVYENFIEFRETLVYLKEISGIMVSSLSNEFDLNIAIDKINKLLYAYFEYKLQNDLDFNELKIKRAK